MDEFDVGCYRKIINREARDFLCRSCLCRDIGWTEERMDRAIQWFREQGCLLFPPLPEDP